MSGAAKSVKFLKQGKVVIVLQGRYAGRKAVIMKNVEDNNEKKWPYGHCVVAGIDRYPLKVKRSMADAKIKKRTAIKPFLKVINHNHIMPTRYMLDDAKADTKSDTKSAEMPSLKTISVTSDVLGNPASRKDARVQIKKAFE